MAGKKSPTKRSAKRSASPRRRRSPTKRTASPKRSASRSASRSPRRKVNKWVRHVKTMSKKLGITLKQAMSDARVRQAYKKRM